MLQALEGQDTAEKCTSSKHDDEVNLCPFRGVSKVVHCRLSETRQQQLPLTGVVVGWRGTVIVPVSVGECPVEG